MEILLICPLVMTWKWPFIVELPLKHGDCDLHYLLKMVIFQFAMLIYLRVLDMFGPIHELGPKHRRYFMARVFSSNLFTWLKSYFHEMMMMIMMMMIMMMMIIIITLIMFFHHSIQGWVGNHSTNMDPPWYHHVSCTVADWLQDSPDSFEAHAMLYYPLYGDDHHPWTGNPVLDQPYINGLVLLGESTGNHRCSH